MTEHLTWRCSEQAALMDFPATTYSLRSKCLALLGPVAELGRERSMKTQMEIDGANFASLEEFYAEVSRKVIPKADWGRNLNAFNDILRGGFGTPEDGFMLVWKNHAVSRERLGYEETVRQLQLRLKRCHPANIDHVGRDLTAAQRHEGPTVFDWLVEIIQDHGPTGQQAQDNVELVLA